MTYNLKIRKIGNSSGVIMNKEMLEKLRLEDGDSILAVETPRGFELTAFNSEVARQLEVAEKVMREDRDVLRRLAE